MAKQDEFIKTALRLPRDLHARIQLAAEKAGRSMNAELIARLYGSLESPPRLTEEMDREFAAMQFFLSVFEKTSEDFDAELGRRTADYFKRFVTVTHHSESSSSRNGDALKELLKIRKGN